MAVQPWVKGIVTKIVDETPSTKRFWIQVPSVENFDFKPGQFVTLDLPIHEKPNKRWRSYSIASWPDGSNTFELVIVLLEDGTGTPWLWENAIIGAELNLRGPQGVFILPESIDKDLYFICTGTGVAPFRSMVHHILNHQLPHHNLYLIFGCRKFCDGLYGEELKELESRVGSFYYLPAYSRESGGNGHLTGYVHQVYENIIRSKMPAVTEPGSEGLPAASFYLCGWKNMIDEARLRLQQLGYDRKAIHFELYG